MNQPAQDPIDIRYRRHLIRLIEHFDLPRVVAEIGVAEGRFSLEMLNWPLDKLYLVDNWGHIRYVQGDGNNPQWWHNDNYRDAQDLLAPFDKEGKVVWLKGMSTAMAEFVEDESLGMVYLDGDHSYKGVFSDLHRWIHKLVPGGIMAGHDFVNEAYGVSEAVQKFCHGKFNVHLINEDKPEDAGFWFQKI